MVAICTDWTGSVGVNLEVAELRSRHPSEKVISDAVRAAPNAVTIIALGPLTNIARVFQRDPELSSLVGQIVMTAGTVSGPGNITPAAEFNIYCDPASAQAVFRSPSTKTLVPLDLTNQIVLSYDLFNQLPDESTKVGKFLREILPPAFRAYRQQFGLEGIHVHDSVALMAAIPSRAVFDRSDGGRCGGDGRADQRGDGFRSASRAGLASQHGGVVSMDKEKVVQKIIRSLGGAPSSP